MARSIESAFRAANSVVRHCHLHKFVCLSDSGAIPRQIFGDRKSGRNKPSKVNNSGFKYIHVHRGKNTFPPPLPSPHFRYFCNFSMWMSGRVSEQRLKFPAKTYGTRSRPDVIQGKTLRTSAGGRTLLIPSPDSDNV